MEPVGHLGNTTEIGCDESGSEGEKLVGGNTDVFAHASVSLSIEAAAACVAEVRDRIRSPATEYKANHLLRDKHRAVLTWLLDPSGPLAGAAYVHLLDKPFFAVLKIVDTVLGHGRTDAVTLYRRGRVAVGDDLWEAFLLAANDLVRTKNQWDGALPTDVFFHALDAIGAATHDRRLTTILRRLVAARPRAELFRRRLLDPTTPQPTVDPLISAIRHTVALWSSRTRAVAIVHDVQSALTPDRVRHLHAEFSGLVSVELVDSLTDPRVQVADFLAGVARKIAEEELAGRGDTELVALLRPYVDPDSVWADARSWARLRPDRVPVEN